MMFKCFHIDFHAKLNGKIFLLYSTFYWGSSYLTLITLKVFVIKTRCLQL